MSRSTATLYKLPITMNGTDTVAFESAAARDAWLNTLEQRVIQSVEPQRRGVMFRAQGNALDLMEYDLIKTTYSSPLGVEDVAFYRIADWVPESEHVAIPMWEFDNILTTLPHVLEHNIVKSMDTNRRTLSLDFDDTSESDGWYKARPDGDNPIPATMDTYPGPNYPRVGAELYAVFLTDSTVFPDFAAGGPPEFTYIDDISFSSGALLGFTYKASFPFVLVAGWNLRNYLISENDEYIVSILQVPEQFLTTDAARAAMLPPGSGRIPFGALSTDPVSIGEITRYMSRQTIMFPNTPIVGQPKVLMQSPYRYVEFLGEGSSRYAFEDFYIPPNVAHDQPIIAEFLEICLPEPQGLLYVPVGYQGQTLAWQNAVIYDRTRVVSFVRDFQESLAYSQQRAQLDMADFLATRQASISIAGNNAQRSITARAIGASNSANNENLAIAQGQASNATSASWARQNSQITSLNAEHLRTAGGAVGTLGSAIGAFAGGNIVGGVSSLVGGGLNTAASVIQTESAISGARAAGSAERNAIYYNLRSAETSHALTRANNAAASESNIQSTLTANSLAALQRDGTIATNALSKKYLDDMPDTAVIGSGTIFAPLRARPIARSVCVADASSGLPNAARATYDLARYYSAFGVKTEIVESAIPIRTTGRQFTYYEGTIREWDRNAARAHNISPNDIIALSTRLEKGVRLWTLETLPTFGNPDANI